MIHQKGDVLRDSARQREERKEVVGGEFRRMVGKGRLQCRDRERGDLEESGFAPVERLFRSPRRFGGSPEIRL